MTRGTTIALVGGAGLLALVLWSRKATAAPASMVLSGVPQGDNGNPLANILKRTQQAIGLAGTAAGVVGLGGGSAAASSGAAAAAGLGVPAAFAAVPAEIGVGASAAAALPGAVAVPGGVAPAGAAAGTSLAGLAAGAGAIAGIAALVGFTIYDTTQYCEQDGFTKVSGGCVVKGCAPWEQAERIARGEAEQVVRASCANAADTGAASFVLAPDGSKVPTYGNVNLTTYEEAVAAGFGEGQY